MSRRIVYILKGVLLVVMLLKLSILLDVPPRDFFPLLIETCETEAGNSAEDNGEEDEFIRMAIQWNGLHLVSSAMHGYPSIANQKAHIREIVPPPPQG